MKAGAFVGTGLLGGASLSTEHVGAALGSDGGSTGGALDPTYTNIRVREALQAWERGYRGRPDRSLALTDSGTDSRHPDIGPWNGVTVTTEDGEFELQSTHPGSGGDDDVDTRELDSERFEGTNQGVVVLGLIDSPELSPADGTERIEVTLDWEDEGVSEMEIRLLEDGTQRTAARGTEGPLTVAYDGYDGDSEYELEIVCWEGVVEYEAVAAYQEIVGGNSGGNADSAPGREIDPFEGVDRTGLPQLVGWHNDHDRYGGYERPRDSNGHGTHVASIMAGSGRASAIDTERTRVDEPRTTLLLGETLSYEVDARAGTGVFASVFGDAIEVVIEGPDGEELARAAGASGTSEESFENNVAETPTVHDDDEATYTVHVRTLEGELITVGRVETVAAGAFLHAGETAADAAEDGDLSLHAGYAPGYSITSLTDLGTATETFGEFADEFAETFNVRAVNMSWGYVGGLPLGAVGGTLDDIPASIRRIAEAGILPVAAAGNDATPASGNGAPAVANEAISVVSTGPYDGIAAYSSGGIGGIDDDSGEPYMKPDVSAPGGQVNVLDIAADIGEPEDDVTEQEPEDIAAADLEPVEELENLESDDLEPKTSFDPSITGDADYEIDLAEEVLDSLLDVDGSLLGNHSRSRGNDDRFGDVRGYTGKAGTSMAAPSVAGIAGLVADAMEDDAPGAISIPEPADAGYEDALRLKQVILATASETALTAAPYHRAKVPVYRFGGRDPYEGYGRANVGPAIDAVTRDLTNDSASGTVGLGVPDDERAVAGYVHVTDPGEVEAAVEFSHYSGANAGATKGDPHVDLFLYDAQNPDELTGEPTIVDKDAGIQGTADVSTTVSPDGLEDNGGERVFYVVAKLVNVPGLVNGFDVRAHLDLETAVDEAGLIVEGARDDSGSVFTGGQTNRTDLDVEVRHPEGEEVLLRDTVPQGWDVDEEFGDVEATTPAFGGGTHVYFGVDDAQSVYEDLTHFAEAPNDVDESGRDTFGPLAVTTDTDDDGTLTDREWVTLSGTDRDVTVVAEET